MKTLPKSRAGFSLIELVVTMTILSILVGVVSFRSGSVVQKSKTTKILSLVDNLKTACALYHADTGEYAYEYTGYSATSRKLSGTQTIAGWNGPYLEAPLANKESNPFGSLHVYNNPKANNWIPGFDVDGDGAIDVDADANMLWLSGIDEATAKLLNDALDKNGQGTWTDAGRVRWSSSSKYAWILLYR
jgi:general secretion pathway protein G